MVLSGKLPMLIRICRSTARDPESAFSGANFTLTEAGIGYRITIRIVYALSIKRGTF